jgi:protein SCO1/2
MGMMRAVLVALLFVFHASALAHEPPRREAAFEAAKSALGQQIPTLSFTAADGRRVDLADLRGRPLLVSLVYTGCADVCPALIENLGPAVKMAQEALGADSFTTVTIGFDTRNDTPARLASYARQHGAMLPNWLFLSADQATLDLLVEAVGFTFFPSAGGFEHMAMVSVVDSDGRLYQQVYGGVFEPPSIVEPLKDLVFGRQRSLASFGGLMDRIRAFCTVYSPNAGRYYFSYSLFIGLAIGMGSLLLVLLWLVREAVRGRGRSQDQVT